MRGEIDDGVATFASLRTEDFIDPAVCDIQFRCIAARVESVRSDTSLDKPDLAEFVPVNEKHTVSLHVGHKENLAVGRYPNILPPLESVRYPITLCSTKSIFASLPWNSQVKIAKRPS